MGPGAWAKKLIPIINNAAAPDTWPIAGELLSDVSPKNTNDVDIAKKIAVVMYPTIKIVTYFAVAIALILAIDKSIVEYLFDNK